jgi:hypothetical protein
MLPCKVDKEKASEVVGCLCTCSSIRGARVAESEEGNDAGLSSCSIIYLGEAG